MSHSELQAVIDAAFEDRENINTSTAGQVRDAVNEALRLLDSGEARVAEKQVGGWVVNQ